MKSVEVCSHSYTFLLLEQDVIDAAAYVRQFGPEQPFIDYLDENKGLQYAGEFTSDGLHHVVIFAFRKSGGCGELVSASWDAEDPESDISVDWWCSR